MMTTTADEKRVEAKEHIQKATEALKEFLHDDTWGRKEYSDEFIEKIENALLQLWQIGRVL